MIGRISKEKRKSVLLQELKRIKKKLREMDIEKAILFGSLARRETGGMSDIDLIIIKNTKKRFLDRLDGFYSLIQPRVSLDLLVYTPKEMEYMLMYNSFIRNAVKNGKVLYAKK